LHPRNHGHITENFCKIILIAICFVDNLFILPK
jgi:hypothetical protein